ncbi:MULTISPECIES: Spy/CpxP family protein refolding chaperone [unclassified Thioalkalivibrio]|uniref:Spy/CpxP family protein refolding chaperone n=1 Tax=unclassified Thioalkalivibrio TaxID=2621013 RepID=UPI0003783462|nr:MULTISPECIES: Spy/CpxP family protein refolding chaperone [unclassified Thioalkalivibrio]
MKSLSPVRWVFGLVLAGCMAPALANSYTTFQDREIKALSAEEQEGLLDGQGLGMALPAELHGYPGPLHVLEVADQLDLSAEQQAETERLFDAMREQARELGQRIVDLERELDERFASREITSDQIEALTVEIGELRGRLRHVHLSYHLEMDELLSDEQKEAYQRARGYEEDRSGAHGHQHGHGQHHGGHGH